MKDEEGGSGKPSGQGQDSNYTGLTIRHGSILLQISKWSRVQNPDGVVFALLLEPTTDFKAYRRQGLARVPEENEMAIKGWERRTVRII